MELWIIQSREHERRRAGGECHGRFTGIWTRAFVHPASCVNAHGTTRCDVASGAREPPGIIPRIDVDSHLSSSGLTLKRTHLTML
jgi:hypothetical protein